MVDREEGRLMGGVSRWASLHRAQRTRGNGNGEPVGSATAVKGIRRRRPKDLRACAHVLGLVYAEGEYPVQWPDAPRAWLDDGVTDAWVFERGGEILGHVAISKVGLDPLSAMRWREVTGCRPSELAGISRLFVRPRARGQGVGAALLEVAVTEIRARGLVPVCEVVSAGESAIRLYEGLGWRERAVYPWGDEDGRRVHYFVLPPMRPGG